MRKYSACRLFALAALGIGLSGITASVAAETESRYPTDIDQYRFHLYPDITQAPAGEASLSEMLEQDPTAAGPDQQLEREIEESGRYHNYPSYQPEQQAGDYPSIGPDWTPTQERGFRPKSQ